MRRFLLALCCASVLLSAPEVRAEAPAAAHELSAREIAERVAALRQESRAEAVRGPLAQAELALQRAKAEGSAEVRQRRLALARAALALAEARAVLLSERALYRTARTRHERAKARANEARDELVREREAERARGSATP